MSDEEQSYPECEKLRKVSNESQSIGDFLEWLNLKKNIILAEYHHHDEGCYDKHRHKDYPDRCLKLKKSNFSSTIKVKAGDSSPTEEANVEHFWVGASNEQREKDCIQKEKDLVCGFYDGQLMGHSYTIEGLLVEFFDIDMKKVEQERRDILNGLQEIA